MICLRPKLDSLKNISDSHIDFVLPEVNNRINFYTSFFNIIQNYIGKANYGNLAKEIKTLKETHQLNNYKTLLNILLKDNMFKSVEDIDVFKNENNYTDLINRSETTQSINDAKTILLNDISEIQKKLTELKDDAKSILYYDIGIANKGSCKIYKEWQDKYEPISLIIKKIFDYEQWFQNLGTNKIWGPYQLAKNIGNGTCPYCNRQYTFTVININGKKLGRPDLDHFLSKDSNPLLALSFYNLIPSCKTCNSLKGNKVIELNSILSPYEINPKHSNMRFSYLPQTYEAAIGKSTELAITLNYSGNSSDGVLENKITQSINIFGLNEVYNDHIDVVQEIIQKRHASNDRYVDILKETFVGFHISQGDVYRLAFGNYFDEEEFHKRPLAKLTKDIAFELETLPQILED